MKKLITIFIFCIIFFGISANVSIAGPLQNPDSVTGVDTMEKFGKGAGFTTADENGTQLGTIIATVIKGFLGLLGIIFIILIIYAGFTWMTAGGDEQKVTTAKETIKKAIIGLVIIVSAYAITAFVFKALPFGDSKGDAGTTGTSQPLTP